MRESQPPQDLRALKALVAGLGVLIVIGTGFVIAVVIGRIYAKPAAPSNGFAAPLVAALPAGTHILGIAPVGAELAVWTSGDEVYLYDPATGTLRVAVGVAK